MGPAAVQLALVVMQNLPALIAAGMNAADLVEKAIAVHSATTAPDDDAWNQLDALIKQYQTSFRQAAG